MPRTSLTRTVGAIVVLCFALMVAAQPAQAQPRQTEEPAWSLRVLLGALNPFVAATPGAAERYERVFEQEGVGVPPQGITTDRAGNREAGRERRLPGGCR